MPALYAVEPYVGLSIMARLLHQVAKANNVWSWQQSQFVANIFLWDSILKQMPSVPSFLGEFKRDRWGGAPHMCHHWNCNCTCQ